MNCQILFSRKNKKNITSLSSAELASRVVKVKLTNPSNLFMKVLKKKKEEKKKIQEILVPGWKKYCIISHVNNLI